MNLILCLVTNMKRANFLNTIALAVLVAVAASGCKGKGAKPTTPIPPPKVVEIEKPSVAPIVQPSVTKETTPGTVTRTVTQQPGYEKTVTTIDPAKQVITDIKPIGQENNPSTTIKPVNTVVNKTPTGIETTSREEFEGMLTDTNQFAAQTVYFDYDSATLKRGETAKVNAVGDALKQKPETKLLIDGHCDERGTEEYNRALGERRALALREYLADYGVAPERIMTRSWGENRPADAGQGEAAWSKNRRGEFILLTPKQ